MKGVKKSDLWKSLCEPSHYLKRETEREKREGRRDREREKANQRKEEEERQDGGEGRKSSY